MIIKINNKSRRFDAIYTVEMCAALLEGNKHALTHDTDEWPFNGEDGNNDDVGLSFKFRKIKGGWSIILWDTDPSNAKDQGPASAGPSESRC